MQKGDDAMTDQADWERLTRRIEDRRLTVEAYLRRTRPRAERLTYVAIVSSASAAALTAGPGAGGTDFTDAVAARLDVAPAAVWQSLCLLGMVTSVVAAISANLSKSRNAEARIVSAEACNAELEGLQTLVEFQQVSLPEALKLYQQYVARVPFVVETPSRK